MSLTQLTYVIVREGDTLASIATRYKSSVATIARLNRLQKDAVLQPGTTLQVPKPQPEPKVTGVPPRVRKPRFAFAYYTGQEGIYPGSEKGLVREGQEGLSGIFPLWFQAAPHEPWKLQSFASDSQIQHTIQTARERQVKIMPVLTNLYYNGVVSGKEMVHQAMNLYREAFLRELLDTYTQYEFDGLVLDWLDLYEADQQAFADWCTQLATSCKSRDLKLVINIPLLPTAKGMPSISLPLSAIGQNADFVVLLLNTEHRMYTMPGPLSSLQYVEAGVRYAIDRGIPPRKILLGLAGYAYDWKAASQVPEYLSFEGAMNRARQYRVNVQLDTISQTPVFRYQDSNGVEHQVWFENTTSLSQKITLVNRYELAGISLWRLGIEDPGLWSLLRYRWGEIRKWDIGFHNIYYEK